MIQIPFLKMHGAGNDFVIIDGREDNIVLSATQIMAISDRHKGVGFDQMVIIKQSQRAECFMHIYNADASITATCGNATRCIASILLQETGKKRVTIETLAGILVAENAGDGLISVDMGKPRISWEEIPLSEPRDTLHLDIGIDDLHDPVGVSMGNPHAVFFVEKNVYEIDLGNIGTILEHHPLFPERANISVAQITGKESIMLRVWERGAGETLACGSAACATLVAARRRGLIEDRALISLKGGLLGVCQEENGHIIMTGEAIHSFSGTLQLV